MGVTMLHTYQFPPNAPVHVKTILSQSAFWIRKNQVRYASKQLQDALDFALAHADFARSSMWNKTKLTALESAILQQKRREQKRAEADRQFRISLFS